jgi:hypothetical protein
MLPRLALNWEAGLNARSIETPMEVYDLKLACALRLKKQVKK